MRRAVCPGSFDPVTNGHVDVINRAAALYDELVVAVLVNPGKAGLFTVEERMELLREAVADLPNVGVDSFHGLLVDYCGDHDIPVIVKGLRAVSDFEYELQMAQMNRELAGIETLFVPTAPQVGHLSSSLVKQIATFGGDVSRLVPKAVLDRLLAQREGSRVTEVVYRLYEAVDELARSSRTPAACRCPAPAWCRATTSWTCSTSCASRCPARGDGGTFSTIAREPGGAGRGRAVPASNRERRRSLATATASATTCSAPADAAGQLLARAQADAETCWPAEPRRNYGREGAAPPRALHRRGRRQAGPVVAGRGRPRRLSRVDEIRAVPPPTSPGCAPRSTRTSTAGSPTS